MNPALITILLLTGQADLPHHHWQQTTAALRAIFAADPRFDLRVIEQPAALTPEALASAQALILNYNGPRFARATEQAIERYIENGGGFLAFHHASYGEFFGMQLAQGRWQQGPTKGWAAFPKIIGANWQPANIGHARRWPFLVEPSSPNPILTEPWQANDELYHRLDLAPTAQILATAQSDKAIGGTGNREPIAWTHRFGQGRVFFTTLGHDAMAFHQPGMQRLFLRAAEWAATGNVTPPPAKPKPVRLLVVTSGHSYPTAFYAMLDSLDGIEYTHAASHAEAFSRPLEQRYDAILFHDMHNATTEQTRARLKAFIEAGKGIVSMHHSIVDYTDWPWWYEEVTGGKYFEKAIEGHPASQYKEGVDFLVSPVKGKTHPVLTGVGPLLIHDETYKNMWLSPRIDVLMETDAPGNDRPVVYIGPHAQARTVYIQPGHSAQTMRDPGFRRLLRNALIWVARQEALP